MLKNKEEFDSLSFEDKKSILIDILDLNMLYENYSDIEDKNSKNSDNVIKFNKSFYEEV